MSAAIVLPDRLESAALEPLRQVLLQHRGADLGVEAQTVVRVDGQGIQLLLSALETWRQDGWRLRLISPSEVLLRAMTSVGMDLEHAGDAA